MAVVRRIVLFQEVDKTSRLPPRLNRATSVDSETMIPSLMFCSRQ